MNSGNTDLDVKKYGCSKCVPLGTLERLSTPGGKIYFGGDINGGCRLFLEPRKVGVGEDTETVFDVYLGQIDRDSNRH